MFFKQFTPQRQNLGFMINK